MSSSVLARVWLLLASLALTAQAPSPAFAPDRLDVAGQPRLSAGYGQLPLSFEANQGQSDEQVRFLSRGRGYSLFLTSTEAVLSLRALGEPDAPAPPSAVVRMRLVGANTDPQLTGLDRLPGTSNYFIGGDPGRWQRDVPNYARVKYADVYPGIDLIYYGNQRQLEYDLVVAPHADPGRIALDFEGTQKISLDADGNLLLETPRGSIAQHKPVIYQIIDGERVMVAGGYVVSATQVTFHVASYDATQPLVIDPVLTYSTYLGGSGNDIGRAIALDGAGNAYVTGETSSTNFPGAGTSAIQSTSHGSYDVFVAKLNAAGTALLYSTYLGGSGGDFAYAIAVDSVGNVYVTGDTSSPTAPGTGNIPFPVVGGVQALYRLGGDAFITKINASGNALLYSTYLGGSGTERGYGIAVDGSGNAYVTGQTNSVNGPGNFPTASPFQPQNGGSVDTFVTKITAAGDGLVYSTYLGGTGSESSIDGGAIAVDSAGNAYVGGTTASGNFPGAGTSTIQGTNGGGVNDGFIVKFNAAGSALVYSTYLGGTGYDAVNGIAIDAALNAYVAGYTDSPNFPTKLPLQPARGGFGNDAFVAKLDAAGSALVYSTYLGGTAGEIAYAIAVDVGGNAYVSGFTQSTNFPTVEPIQITNGGLDDAFVSEINPSGSALLYSTYLGAGTGHEFGYGIAVDGSGNAYVTGKTNSTNFPTVAPFQATFGGAGDDAFVAKIDGGAQVPTNVTATLLPSGNVMVAWTGSAGVSEYQVRREGGCCAVYQTTPDTTLVVGANPGAAYLFFVRAFDSVTGSPTAFSAPDLVTNVMFTDDPLIVSSTLVKAIHVVDLRTAVNAVRFLSTELGAPLPPYPFTDGSLPSVAIKKVHIMELRTALGEARATLGLPAVTYMDPVLTSGLSTIKAAHIMDLRAGVK